MFNQPCHQLTTTNQPTNLNHCCLHTHSTQPLRTRHSLAPIGTVLDNTELRDKLSAAEQKFTTEFFVAMGRHLKSSVLDELPSNYQSLVRAGGCVGGGWEGGGRSERWLEEQVRRQRYEAGIGGKRRVLRATSRTKYHVCSSTCC